MEKIKGYKLQELPISGLNKVSDLIFFDGPILSHFIDGKKNDYLFLWVDNDAKFNRWFVWKVKKVSLRQYLTKSFSLKNLLIEKNKDFVYSIEIDNELKYNNIIAMDIDDLPINYIPEEESFYMLKLNPIYAEYFSSNEIPSAYIEGMRASGIYFKLTPKLNTYSTSVSISDAADFLYNLKSSYLNYIEFDFFNRFKNRFTDAKKLVKIQNRIKEILIPRLYDVKWGSFEVAINSDNTNHIDENSDKEITLWQHEILHRYQEDVIDVNYNEPKQVEEIISKYPTEVRKKIFQPIIEIAQSTNYSTLVTIPSERMAKNLIPANKDNKEKIIPSKISEVIDEIEPNKKLLSFVLEVTDSDNIKSIGKRELQSGLLFLKETNNIPAQFANSIVTKTRTFNLKQSIEYTIGLDNNIYTLECKGLELIASGSEKEIVYANFYRKLDQLHVDLQEKKDTSKDVADFFNAHIGTVILLSD